MGLEFRYRLNLRIGGDEWTNRRVEAWRDGEKLGHLTIAFISRATFDELFPDVEDYARRIKGIENPTGDDCEILYSYYRSFEVFHVETAHVAYVIVEEEHQRQGIGRPEVGPLWAKLVEDASVETVRLHDGRWALDGRS
jgi:GNAT superfamily N-acetyltransferase